MNYPKWLYHKEKEAVLVQDQAQEKELGKGWEDSPAKFADEIISKAEDKAFKSMKVDELKEMLTEKMGFPIEDVDHLKKDELIALAEGKI